MSHLKQTKTNKAAERGNLLIHTNIARGHSSCRKARTHARALNAKARRAPRAAARLEADDNFSRLNCVFGRAAN